MAWHYCNNHNPAKRFWVGTPGRPPKRCNECRGITELQVTYNTEPVTAIDTLPNDVVGTEPIVNGSALDNDVVTEDLGKTNFYAGTCHYCETHVAKEQGYRLKVNDVWKVRHTYCTANTGGLNTAPAVEPVTVIDPATGIDIAAEVSRITGEIVEPIVKRNVDRAITAFVNDTLPDMLTAAMLKAQVVRHEYVINGEVKEVEGSTNVVFPRLMQRLTAGKPGKRLNVALPGPAGSGKSYLAVQAAKVLDLKIGIISFGPITDTSKLFGYMDANGNYVRTPFREIWEHGGIFLADEMDNAHPGLLAELNQALAGDIAAFADGMVERHPEFRCIATMNTYGSGPDRVYAGRNQLDRATLNRFVWLEVLYDEALEDRMALAWATDDTEVTITRWVRYVRSVRAKATEAKLPLVFGPRNIEQGAMLIANGMDIEEVKEACMFTDVSDDVKARIEVRF